MKNKAETSSNTFISKALETVKLGRIFSSPKVVVLMGLPGSGKSYVANYLNKVHGFTVLSGENITNALYATNKANFSLVYEILHQLAIFLLNKGHSIVIDGTNLKFSFRKQIYDKVCKNTKPYLIYLLVDDKTAKTRIKKRGENIKDHKDIKSICSEETFRDFKKQIEEPTSKEPCYRVVSDKNLLKEIDLIIS